MSEKTKIIALHGAGMSPAAFGAVAPLLTQFLFQAVTLPGHDARRGDALLPDIGGMAHWLRDVLDAEGDNSIVLLGHSMGALVALEAASHQAVRGVIALGAAPLMPVNEVLLHTARMEPHKAQELVARWSCFDGHAQAAAMQSATLAMLQTVPAVAIHNDLAACNAYAGEARTDKPLLVISGARDKMTPSAQGLALAERSGGAARRRS